MPRKKKIKTKKEIAKLMHLYYSRTGFYMFIWESIKKTFIPVSCVIISLFLLNKYVFNINELLASITESLSKLGVFSLFFTSETILGLIPPEIFIAWSKKTSEPILNLTILTTLSYFG